METDTSAEALERQRFEEWITSPPFEKDIKRMGEETAWPGNYRYYEVQLAWCTWQHLAAEKRRAREGVTDDDAAAWMFPSDLEDFEQAETNAWAYSIKMVRPGEETVPLFTRAALEAVWPDGYFIGGPHASAMVYDMADAENVIAALAKRTGDDEDDYTVTSLAAQEGRSRE